jgi:hypothetical protein
MIKIAAFGVAATVTPAGLKRPAAVGMSEVAEPAE